MPGYELRALIGVGQLGEVHRAYQASVGREVAVRIFGPGMVGHPQFVRRFETASQRITGSSTPTSFRSSTTGGSPIGRSW